MEDNERADFADAFMTLCWMWEKEPSDRMIEMWWQIFSKYSLQDFQKGITAALSQLKNYGRLPMPSDIIELIETSGVDLDSLAEVEASGVIQAIKTSGSYNSVIFKDTTTMAVVQHGFGGWVQLCADLNSNEEKWFRKDFVRIYRAYKRSGLTHIGKLVGILESNNTESGLRYTPKNPIQLPDSSKGKL